MKKLPKVEKLSTTMVKLEEVILANGAYINATWDYHQQVEELLVSILKL